MEKIRLTKTEIEKIKEMIRRGESLNYISKSMKNSKTTIYYHFRKIKGLSVYPVKINAHNSELVGEFIGLVAGDGCLNITKNYQYRTYLYFNATEYEYAKELKKCLFVLFHKNPMTFQRQNLIILAYYSKSIYNFVLHYLKWNSQTRKSHSVRLKTRNHTKMFKIGFLRGCLDSDGYLSDKKIMFSTSSYLLSKDIKSFLEDLDLDYRYSKYKEKRPKRVDMYHINIRKNESIRFLSLIKPSERKNISASAGTF